jgi:hypothetical protein
MLKYYIQTQYRYIADSVAPSKIQKTIIFQVCLIGQNFWMERSNSLIKFHFLAGKLGAFIQQTKKT